jgi:hypothetical protein
MILSNTDLYKFLKRRIQVIKSRCNNPKHTRYAEYGGRGIKCYLTIDNLHTLWVRDKAWKMVYPTVDRIIKFKSYTLDNCQWLEMKENDAKDKRISVIQLDRNFNKIMIWNSVREASRILGIPHSNISNVLNNKRKHAGNFIWRYNDK